MSEEQTGFKVTDRRLFNADGTPRDVEREERPDQPAATTADARDASSASARQTPPPSESAPAQPRVTDERAGGAGSARAGRVPQDEAYEESHAESGIPGADDPASFLNFLMSIASNAAAALGMMEHPVTGERGVDLQLAKHWIDVLGMLEEKTRGNLAPQEQQIFEGLLSDLRLQYVSLTSAAPPTQKRGFTGRDILGGK
jgi:hypothetical protein